MNQRMRKLELSAALLVVLATSGWVDAKDGDMIFIVADTKKTAYDSMAALRRKLGRDLGLRDEKRFDFLWVTDFPL